MPHRRPVVSTRALATAAALPRPVMAMSSAVLIRPQLVLFDVNETLLGLGKRQRAVNVEFKSEFAGARHAGLQAAFIARPGQQHPLAPPPTRVGPTLEAVASQLIGLVSLHAQRDRCRAPRLATPRPGQ